jgi:hypothetical protein
VAGERPDDPESAGDGGERVRERASPRHPELVGVGVDDPVGAVLGRREAGHAGAPDALPHRPGLPEETQPSRALVRLEDLGRPVPRVVVGREHEVDARVEVVGDLGVDDVDLVANHQGLDELHRRKTSSNCAITVSTP